MKVKKYMCALLAAILFTSCFGTTVDAAVCATGRFTVSFPATFVAGNDIIIMGNIKVLK